MMTAPASRRETRASSGPAPDLFLMRAQKLRQMLEGRPERLDIKFPIMGFLMDSEMTGYGLKRTFEGSLGFFYRVSDGSLYPALKRLARDGLVKARTERQGRRASTVYSI